MVVLALPGWMPDAVACGMVLQLAQTMVYLAGPSTEWMVQQQDPGGGTAYAMIKRPLQVCAIRTLTRGWDQGLDLAIISGRYAGEKHEPSPGLVGTCVDLCALRRSCLTACARAH